MNKKPASKKSSKTSFKPTKKVGSELKILQDRVAKLELENKKFLGQNLKASFETEYDALRAMYESAVTEALSLKVEIPLSSFVKSIKFMNASLSDFDLDYVNIGIEDTSDLFPQDEVIKLFQPFKTKRDEFLKKIYPFFILKEELDEAEFAEIYTEYICGWCDGNSFEDFCREIIKF